MNRPVLSAALFGCNIRRVIFNVFAGNAVLAPVNHSVEYNWLREAIPFYNRNPDRRCREWMHCVARSALHSLPSRCVSGLHRLIQRKHSQFASASTSWCGNTANAGNAVTRPTVESLASIAHMSRASFAQLFRDVSGTTPLAVLTKLRLQIAAQMFSREMLPVVVIAESVGYASESSFHKAFVREFGCTPGEYRERVRQLAP